MGADPRSKNNNTHLAAATTTDNQTAETATDNPAVAVVASDYVTFLECRLLAALSFHLSTSSLCTASS